MGGGASSGGIESLLQTTMMVGRAIANIYRNPGMYRLQDFHSSKAPRLKSQRQPRFIVFGGDDSDEEEEDDDYEEPDPMEYEHLFNVEVNEETFYFEDILYENEEGWTALHTCCMSSLCTSAAERIIDEVVRRGGNIDIKTKFGPGTFNKGWTALLMASAYGVEPVVAKLCASGADVNTMNCFGSCPLMEACHRGYFSIVEILIKYGADLEYLPEDSRSNQSPFQAAPAHTALGEASRCGYTSIVDKLLAAGAKTEATNGLGWTPLHEACFYNRVDAVKSLLNGGANATVRTTSGALPYHLSGLQSIRGSLEDMGGPGAIPNENDTINMLAILQEITSGVSTQAQGHQMQFVLTNHHNNDVEQADDMIDQEEEFMRALIGHHADEEDEDDGMQYFVVENAGERQSINEILQQQMKDSGDGLGAKDENDVDFDRLLLAADDKRSDDKFSSPQRDAKDNELLHSGKLLGDLPSLQKNKSPISAHLRSGNDLDAALSPSKKADGKSKVDGEKKKKKKSATNDVPPDMPRSFLCTLSGMPMSDPVKSVYGHCYDKPTIYRWLEQQGKICPLTGAPLVESDLQPQPELANQVVQWFLKKSQQEVTTLSSSTDAVTNAVNTMTNEANKISSGTGVATTSSITATATTNNGEDDLYEF